MPADEAKVLLTGEELLARELVELADEGHERAGGSPRRKVWAFALTFALAGVSAAATSSGLRSLASVHLRFSNLQISSMGGQVPCEGTGTDLSPGEGNEEWFACSGSPHTCINAVMRCDGVPNCEDGSDEGAAASCLVTDGAPPPDVGAEPPPAKPAPAAVAPAEAALETHPAPEAAAAPDGEDPMWGCGLLGRIPGIGADGSLDGEAQRMVGALKATSSVGKVSYWNWKLAPDPAQDGQLSADFLFMPEHWGAGVMKEDQLRPAGEASPAEMAPILLGMNEPDIQGSCMGNMFGECLSQCTDGSVNSGDCPMAELDQTLLRAHPNALGECNCVERSHATGVGFWSLDGCSAHQPLPQMWQDPGCADIVMQNWMATASLAVAKGYKYLSTPLVAADVGFARQFLERACGCSGGQCGCTDASCGCPVYVGFHFYAYDCRPESTGAYQDFQARLAAVTAIMEAYPFVKGAIINEIGMLNCAPNHENPICVPNSGQYPADTLPGNTCPVNDELPKGMGTYIERIMDLVNAARTSTGRRVVKSVSWFNADMDGGTYNLELFDPDNGRINQKGESYMAGCTRWAEAIAAAP